MRNQSTEDNKDLLTKESSLPSAPVEEPALPGPPLGGEAALPPPRKSRKKLIIAGAALVALVCIAAAILGGSGSGPTAGAATTEFEEAEASRRNISVTLTGNGTLEAADSYTVTTLKEGDVLSAPFEEGDLVEKDAMLYEIDSSDAKTSIEQAEISLAQSQRSYSTKVKSLDDLKVRAAEAGRVISIEVKKGDDVKAGDVIAVIKDTDTMTVEVPFGSDDAQGFSIGQSAEVTLDGSFEVLSGTVSKISGVDEVLTGNMLIRKVTIDVTNPGGISPGQYATATVGGVSPTGSGTFSYKGEATITAKTSGEVSAINVKEGDFVNRDQLLVTLSSDTLQNDILSSSESIRNSELSLESRYDQLDDYTIKSPISGTIIEKNYKEGDTVESGKTLCTIFDLTYLTMTLYIDELDISKIKEGLPVIITADAVEGKVYEGLVTKVNINGTTQNGVTSYPVTIRIDVTDGLLPGMNVDATIMVESATDVLAVPVGAVQRGGRVLVKTGAAAPPSEDGQPVSAAPEGYEYREVKTGVSDQNYIEILEGLEEGDIVANYGASASQGGMMMGGDMMVMGGPGGGGGGTVVVSGGSAPPSGGGGRR